MILGYSKGPSSDTNILPQHKLRLYENIGNATTWNFSEKVSWSLDQACGFEPIVSCLAYVGDFDGDGVKRDIMVHTYSTPKQQIGCPASPCTSTDPSPHFVRNSSWEVENGLPDLAPGVVVFGDVDKDGDDDAVVAAIDSSLHYYERTQQIPPKWE